VDLAALTSALDELAELDPSLLAGPETIVELERARARMEAITARAVGAFDALGGWAPDGAQTCRQWLKKRCRMRDTDAGAQVRRGRNLRDLPSFATAWVAGEVTGSHVDLVASVRTTTTEEALAEAEPTLLEHATSLRYADFERVVRYWEQVADPDGAEDKAQSQRDRRGAWLSQSFLGDWFGKVHLDPIAGSAFSQELQRLYERLFADEWAKTKEQLGRPPELGELPRTPSQRRADALVEMARRSRSCGTGDRRPGMLVSVLVDFETLHGRICELANGTVVTPGSLLHWLTDAYVERAVFAPGNRVEVGPAVRFFEGATRRAVELRDRRCTHPYCDKPAQDCEVDHVVRYSDGGPTTQENGRLLCPFHNRLRNQGLDPPDPTDPSDAVDQPPEPPPEPDRPEPDPEE
jgi:hypothetical protein